MKVLIVGLGSIGKRHATILTQINPNVEIYALRSSMNNGDPKNVKSIYSWSELNIQPDFILVANPTSCHYETIIRALELECPLFVEKPIMQDMKGVNEVLAIVSGKNIITYVACYLRFHPCIKYLKEFLSDNSQIINEVNIYCGSYLPEWRYGQDYKKSYSAIAELGGGAHLDLIHEIDYAYWLFGKPQKSIGTLSAKSSLGISSVDYANYLLTYAGFNVNVVLNYYRRRPKRSMEVLFQDETWSIDLLEGCITNGETIIFQSDVSDKDNIYREQMTYFINCVKKREDTFNSFEEAFEVLDICLNSSIV